MLSTYAFFKVHDRAMSEDLVQQTFIKTWIYLVKTGKIDLMKTFLYHILNNLIVDQYRKKKTVSLDLLLEKGYEPAARDYKRIFNVIDGKSAFGLIKRLPEKYQKVMSMRYKQDLSLKDISDQTGQSKNTIAVQLFRGLEKLKILYTPA
jgi:RNA polymerase sigma-70 factor, ECF subfamily